MDAAEGDLVAGFISSVLPKSSTNELVLEALRNMGVGKVEDLKYVNEADLKNVMRPIDARKLIASVKALSENDASGIPDPPPRAETETPIATPRRMMGSVMPRRDYSPARTYT
ncbi:hypothetical protein KUCAC02_031951 [Chaenocephalus aceratus]|nr:hypothetical protein KUCAC02_031951 [Chaenocephalus aceratus]